mmetsp:Transcript_352/g.1112  ORF Transcript_352/g.1112 Transcript_352/m.1112 type:complete len:548 (+) Transcript_352:702-2345(+)
MSARGRHGGVSSVTARTVHALADEAAALARGLAALGGDGRVAHRSRRARHVDGRDSLHAGAQAEGHVAVAASLEHEHPRRRDRRQRRRRERRGRRGRRRRRGREWWRAGERCGRGGGRRGGGGGRRGAVAADGGGRADPWALGADASVHAGVLCEGAATAPTDDAHVNEATVGLDAKEWPSRVALARVLAASGRAGAQHAVANLAGAVRGGALRVGHGGHGHLHGGIGERAARRSRAPASDGERRAGRGQRVVERCEGADGRVIDGRVQLQERDVVLECRRRVGGVVDTRDDLTRLHAAVGRHRRTLVDADAHLPYGALRAVGGGEDPRWRDERATAKVGAAVSLEGDEPWVLARPVACRRARGERDQAGGMWQAQGRARARSERRRSRFWERGVVWASTSTASHPGAGTPRGPRVWAESGPGLAHARGSSACAVRHGRAAHNHRAEAAAGRRREASRRQWCRRRRRQRGLARPTVGTVSAERAKGELCACAAIVAVVVARVAARVRATAARARRGRRWRLRRQRRRRRRRRLRGGLRWWGRRLRSW